MKLIWLMFFKFLIRIMFILVVRILKNGLMNMFRLLLIMGLILKRLW